MEANHKKCLLINADYSPLGIISWKRAVIWSIRYEHNPTYGVEIIDFYKNDHIQGTDNKKFPIPAVAKTKRYFKIHSQPITFSRKNIFVRDNHSCQYCGKQCDIRDLTYDHVIPKSKWTDPNRSPTSWTNIVTACTLCNRIKGNRTPKEANMPLLNKPIIPNKNLRFLPIIHTLNKIKTDLPAEWNSYLPPSFNQ